MKLAIKRHIKDLENDDFEFRPEFGQHAIDFIEILQHSSDTSAGKHFILESWEIFLIGSIFSWFNKGTDILRYTSSFLEVGRKNGKSSLSIAMALYHFVTNSQNNAEILITANSAKQCRDVLFKITLDFLRHLDPQQTYIRQYHNELRFKKTGSFLKILASDVSNLAGYNASFSIVDEFYGAKNHQIRELIRTSMVARENKHLMVTSTSGFDLNSPCYEFRNSCINILEETGIDDSVFVMIYELDPEDSWEDSKNWIKANPNLGITVRESELADLVKKAQLNPSIETEIRTLNMNQWMTTKSVWIQDKYVSACFEELKIEDFHGEHCIIGIDLGSVSDLTAVSVLFERDNEFYIFPIFYMPQDTISERSDQHAYRNWIQRGHIQVTPGNVCDYDYITADLLEIDKNFFIKEIVYDRWNSTQFAVSATDEGLPLHEFSQSIGNFNGPTREVERLIMKGQLHIQNNEILMNHFRNVELKRDHNGNVKPIKSGEERKKIDGVIALIQAVGSYFYNKPQEVGHIY